MISNATTRLVNVQELNGILDAMLRLAVRAAESPSMSYKRLK